MLSAGLITIGTATTFAWYVLGWAVIGLGMSASLYDAAFSTLGSIYGAQARSAISALTLLGGFASTVCWPLSAILAAQVGWRGACFCYALLQIAVALPTHLLALRDVRQTQLEVVANKPKAFNLLPSEHWLFLIVAAVLTLAAAILSMMGTHLLPIRWRAGSIPRLPWDWER